MAIVINASTSIPDAEIQFSAARSAGPGGQNVNKVNSRVILEFDLIRSSALTSYQKRRISLPVWEIGSTNMASCACRHNDIVHKRLIEQSS